MDKRPAGSIRAEPLRRVVEKWIDEKTMEYEHAAQIDPFRKIRPITPIQEFCWKVWGDEGGSGPRKLFKLLERREGTFTRRRLGKPRADGTRAVLMTTDSRVQRHIDFDIADLIVTRLGLRWDHDAELFEEYLNVDLAALDRKRPTTRELVAA